MGPGIIRLLRPRTGGAPLLRAAVLAVLAAAALLSHPAMAQSLNPRTASANQSAVILTPGSIVKTANMGFGTIAVAGTAGTVVLSSQATATCTPSGTLVHSGGCQAAAFIIRGIRNQHVRIRDAGNTGVVTLTGPGGATMTLDTLNVTVSGMTASGNGGGWRFGNWLITSATGNAQFWVGGTLHVAGTQAPGLYNGTLTIQIQFN